MNFVTAIKNLIAPSAASAISKLDAHLLADMGFNTANARTSIIRTPAEAGVRLV